MQSKNAANQDFLGRVGPGPRCCHIPTLLAAISMLFCAFLPTFKIIFSITTTKALGARYESMNAYLSVMPVRSKQVMLLYPVYTLYSGTYTLLCSRI